jgi:hypothetical protein
VNANLWKELAPYFANIAAWYWGHEHSFKVYEPYVGPEGQTLQKGRLIGHGSKWKKSKSNVIPFVPVEHPVAREIGLAVLEISEDRCTAKYLELAGEGSSLSLVENYRELL